MNLIPTKDCEPGRYPFDSGICFDCTQCGACCVGEPGTIYVSSAEIKAIAESLNKPIDEFTDQYVYPYKDSFSIKEDHQGACLFFDDGCTIYDIRPLQCRTFPFWFSNLRSQSNWQYIKNQCPGIGRGRHYSRSEILELVHKSMRL